MQPETKKDFFISFNKADRAWAEWIAWQLEEAGYTTVFQGWDFRPGGNFVLDMQRAAEQAERTVAVLSPDYLTAQFTHPEWAQAFAQDPTGEKGLLVPVLVRETELRGLLPQITHLNLVNLSEPAAKTALLAGVRRGRAKPEAKPEFPPAARRSVPERPRFPGALPGIWNVPHNRNPHFTGREDFLDALDKALTSGQPAALTQALHGLGGVGKTQLATEYAYRNSHRYEVVWWVRSEETATLAADYAALAAKLGLEEANQPNQSIVVEAVRRWFGQNAGWLLIFDNANRREEIRPYLPQGTTGHVIITSRDRDWKGLAAPLEVKTMPRPESVEFLLKRTSQTDADSASALASELGDLPLALEQAAAYVDATSETLASYLRLFRAHHRRLLSRGTPSTNYPDTVATTWDISFAEVRKQSAASEPLINLCAFLAPDDIPLEVIRDGSQFLPEPLVSAVTDPIALDDALAPLLRYSLVERRAQSLFIHRLVQFVVLDRLPEADHKTWAEAAVRLLNAAFPFEETDVRTWPASARLLQHVLTAIERARELEGTWQTISILLDRVGQYLFNQADYPKAKAAFEQALQIAESLFNPNHPTVAILLNNLGVIMRRQNDLEGAQASYERALAINEAIYGPDHSEVANVLSNLGNIFRNKGDLNKARASYERALAIDEATHGLNHPDVAIRVSNLGGVLREQGDLEGAQASYERALVIAEAAFGPSHPIVATQLNNLGLVLRYKGDLVRALANYERALAIDEEAYGPDHPDVAIDVNNIGQILQDLGDSNSARANLERALRIFRQFLGEQHPNTLIVQENLKALRESEK